MRCITVSLFSGPSRDVQSGSSSLKNIHRHVLKAFLHCLDLCCLGIFRPEVLFLMAWESPECFLDKWVVTWLLSDCSTIKTLLVKCYRDGCPSDRLSHLHHLHIGPLEFCQSTLQVLDLKPVGLFNWALGTGSRKSVGDSKHVPFKDNRGHCVLHDLPHSRIIWYSSLDLCRATNLFQRSMDNSFHLIACSALT